MKNYICIDGKKAELTEEQLKALGIEPPKASPFKKESYKKEFYYINPRGYVEHKADFVTYVEREMYEVANYCTDKSIMEQRALHETLNRLLWRYSMEHDGDKIDWNDGSAKKYHIFYHHGDKAFGVTHCWKQIHLETVQFYTRNIAEAAIEEIIKPFMKAHPDFKW